MDISGWVRNRRDGTVEALVIGEAAVIDSLLARIEEGPSYGRVDRVDVTVETGDDDRYTGFDIRSDR